MHPLRQVILGNIWKRKCKCNQCGYAFPRADVLREHLKTHRGEKHRGAISGWDWIYLWVIMHSLWEVVCGYIWHHIVHCSEDKIWCRRHSGGKSNKCNQCSYAFSQAGTLRTHLIPHSGESPHKCRLRQAVWGHILKHIMEKSHTMPS